MLPKLLLPKLLREVLVAGAYWWPGRIGGPGVLVAGAYWWPMNLLSIFFLPQNGLLTC